MWALLALTSALLASINPILYKRLLREIEPPAAVWAVLALALPLLALTTLATTPLLPHMDMWFAVSVLASAALNAFAHLAWLASLRLEDASLVTPLLTFGPALTLLISYILLGESPTSRGIIGVGLVLAGAYWLNRRPAAHPLSWLPAILKRPALLFVLAAGLLWAVTPVLERTAIEHTDPESPRLVALAVQTMLVLLLTPVAVWRGRSGLRPLARLRGPWVSASFIAGIAPAFGYTAISLGLVGYVTTLFRLSAAFTVLWGGLFLHEPNLRQRLPASIVMVAGAILIAA